MTTLQARLNQATQWDAETTGDLSNHLPMALAALHRLGASDERLGQYTARYTPRLHPAPAIEPWPAGNPWRERFGDPHAWPIYRDFFRQWLVHEGVGDVLQQALPWLMQGCGAAAFHGLIRTAYAFDSMAAAELADALAYWSCRWVDLGTTLPARRGEPVRDPAQLLNALAALATATRSQGGLISHRMQAAVQARGFAGAAAQLQVDAATLPRLARQSARLYARSGNFTVLHLVTSAHAVRVLLPLLDEPLPAMAAYWRAWAGGVVAARFDAAQPGRVTPLRDWAELAAAASASDDGHLVMLVDTCRQEQAAYNGAPDWQRAASRAVHDAARRGGATRAAQEPAC